MKKMQKSPIIAALCGMAFLAVFTLIFRGGLTASVIVEPEELENLINSRSANFTSEVLCEDSDRGFSLFDAGRAVLIIDGKRALEMKDLCLAEDYDISEIVCDGYKIKQVKSRCPVLQFIDHQEQSLCIETEFGARCETCADYGLVSKEGICS